MAKSWVPTGVSANFISLDCDIVDLKYIISDCLFYSISVCDAILQIKNLRRKFVVQKKFCRSKVETQICGSKKFCRSKVETQICGSKKFFG